MTSAAVAQPEKKVLMIGIDGAGGRYVRDTATPNLDALSANGAVRYDFFNEGGLFDSPPEGYGASGVNWSTIVSGYSAANHGVIDNSFANNRFEEFPHFFAHVKAADPTARTVSIANWTPINTQILADEFADVELDSFPGNASQRDVFVKNNAVAELTNNNADAIFLHFDQVDGAGHAFSWGSIQHTTAIQVVDGLVGEVMTALNNRPGVVSGNEDWLVLVSADHGATPGSFGHFASQGEANWEVPYIASGPSVVNGSELGKGSLRDLATTALWHLGVDPFLAGLDGAIRGLEVEFPSGVFGDLNSDGIVSGNGLGPGSTDDVTRFLDNWLVSGPGGVNDRLGRGDVNLDGITDLADWAQINNLDPALGGAIASAFAVPEPLTAVLLVVAVAAASTQRPYQS